MATLPSSTPAAAQNRSEGADYTFPLTVLTSLFFLWGFITCLNDILIPHLKGLFNLNYMQSMLIQFTFFMAYFVVSLPSGFIVEKVGYKRGIVIGLITAGIGCLMFYPAAGTRSYGLFLAALFVLASGITLLQVSANPFVAILGKPEHASSRLNLTQAFNSLGTTIAPLLGSFLILGAATKTMEEIARMSVGEQTAFNIMKAASVQKPYLAIAAALFIIAGAFAVIKLPVIMAADQAESHGVEVHDDKHESAWKYNHLILGALGIFLYVGAEVSIGSFLVSFLHQPNIANLSLEVAGKYLAFYWGGAMIGRFIGSAVLRAFNPGKVLANAAMAAGLLVTIAMVLSGKGAMWSILAVGLFNSIMFPTIFTLALEGLGKHTGQGSGILCMAIVGGALVPLLQGYFADHIGIHHAFFLPVLCYVYIAYYGFRGHVPSYAAGKPRPEA